MIDYDDDNLYETYVPQVGEMYAEGTVYKSRGGGPWLDSTIMRVENPENDKFTYRRPKPSKKEVPMSIPEGWRVLRVLGDDEVIQKGDKRQDNDDAPGYYRPCMYTVGMTVEAAKEDYNFIDHVIREIGVPTPVTTTPTVPQRTERDALKAADESGAIKAWYSGKPVQVHILSGSSPWETYAGEYPNFMNENLEWRPAPAEPPKAVKLDYRPVSEPPVKGTKVLAFHEGDWIWLEWYTGAEMHYTHWAPQPLAPEAE